MAARRADMFIDFATDPGADPPSHADERATLAGFLAWQRATLELKCSGLDAAALASRSLEPSSYPIACAKTSAKLSALTASIDHIFERVLARRAVDVIAVRL